MTPSQRIALMADWYPKACEAQGWDRNDRAKRLEVLSEAVGRPLRSANELDAKGDIDRVKAFLGMKADSLQATREMLNPEAGEARRYRHLIRRHLAELELDDPEAYLARLIQDKFKNGAKHDRLGLGDLDAGQAKEILMRLAALASKKRRTLRAEPVSVPVSVVDGVEVPF